MSPWRHRAAAVLLGLFVVACTEGGGPNAQPDRRPTFEAVTFDGWSKKLASYPPDIVVVDMWATWCASCLERFPHMVRMWKAYRAQGVRFVSLNLDDHADSDALAEAQAYLNRFGAGFENYYMDENLMAAFARLDLIGIPAVVIYDREGNEAVRLTGDNPNRQFTEDDVEATIKALLAGG